MTKEKKEAQTLKTPIPEAEVATHAQAEEAEKAAENPAPPSGDLPEADFQVKPSGEAHEKTAENPVPPSRDLPEADFQVKPSGEAHEKTKEDKAKKAKVNPAQALAERYARYYPDSKEFHITSDGQVFLSGDKNLAILHQSGLPDGELQTIKVK